MKYFMTGVVFFVSLLFLLAGCGEGEGEGEDGASANAILYYFVFLAEDEIIEAITFFQ